jgi:3-oxoacyl-(acyl-carrier-protein) synthase
MEYETLIQFFDRAPQALHVTPLKYLMGDFGGAGVTRAAAILLSFRNQTSLPTLPAEVLRQKGQVSMQWGLHSSIKPHNALMLSGTFGGGSSCIVLQCQN